MPRVLMPSAAVRACTYARGGNGRDARQIYDRFGRAALEDVLLALRRCVPGALEVILREAVAVEGVEQLDGLLYGTIGEVVDGEDGLRVGFQVELDEGVGGAECDERGFEHAGERLDGGELGATPQDLWVQGHEAPPAAVAAPLGPFLPSIAPLTPSGNAAS
jgi:hypothetical protein